MFAPFPLLLWVAPILSYFLFLLESLTSLSNHRTASPLASFNSVEGNTLWEAMMTKLAEQEEDALDE